MSEEKEKKDTEKKTSSKSSSSKPKKVKKNVHSPVRKKNVRRVSFNTWSKRRGIREHHKGGLRAFVKNANQPRTMEEWDKAFENY